MRSADDKKNCTKRWHWEYSSFENGNCIWMWITYSVNILTAIAEKSNTRRHTIGSLFLLLHLMYTKFHNNNKKNVCAVWFYRCATSNAPIFEISTHREYNRKHTWQVRLSEMCNRNEQYIYIFDMIEGAKKAWECADISQTHTQTYIYKQSECAM